MAGEKGKRSSAQEHRGGEEREEKGKRSLAQEHRGGGEERGPKIRKVTHEEIGKSKGKSQIKERDKKPMELEKTRRPEEEKAKKRPEDRPEEDESSRQMREKKIASFKTILDEDCDGVEIPDFVWPFFEGGLARLREINDIFRTSVKDLKEFAAWRLKEEFNIDYHGKALSHAPLN